MDIYKTLKMETKEALCVMTLNRPDKYNALNDLMANELEDAFREFANDPSTRVAIITGSGKAFMSGADIEEIRERNPEENLAYNQKIMNAFSSLERQPKPVIAAINGFAFGGGLELALACTFRIAVSETKMGLPEVRLGILPGAGGTQRLPRLIGKQQALRMILTGGAIDASEALRLGLVMEVVPSKELMGKAHELAQGILDNGPLAVAMAKDAVEMGMQIPLEQALAYTHRNLATLMLGEEMQEGLNSFIEKRKPFFTQK